MDVDLSKKRERIALLRMFLGAFMISLSGVFVKIVEVGPTTSAFYRSAIGGLILCVLLKVRGIKIRPSLHSGVFLVIAGFAFAGDLFAWHQSILFVGVGLATLLGNFQVFFMAAAAVLIFRERMNPLQLIAIPLAVFGLYLIVGVDWATLEQTSKIGVGLGLATAIFYTLYMLALRQAHRCEPSRDAAADLAVASIVTALALIPLAAFTGESLVIGSWTDFAWLTLYAFIAQVVGWILITGALPYLPTFKIGLALLLQPTLAYIWGVLIFKRELQTLEMVGAAIAIFAIFLGSRRAGD